MIDIESDVYAAVAGALKLEMPGIYTASEYVAAPARFPAAIIFQADLSVYQRASTTNIENADTVLFEVYAYSNAVGLRKEEAKKIIAVADDVMARLGFTRIGGGHIPNIMDATIYQMVARYRGVVDRDLMVYTG